MKIQEKFLELKNKNEGALIGFVTAGYPTTDDTIDIIDSLIGGGVDIIELGLPFSDPIADGQTIQKASEMALKSGMNPDIYFKIVKEIDAEIPMICLTYYNLILQRGLKRFVRDCRDSGISGLIVPDLPIEESESLLKSCTDYGVDLIFLIAPTTTEKRLRMIMEKARGFLYVVSLLGVTGARRELSKTIKPTIDKVKKIGKVSNNNIPIAVGFGISKPEHVRKILNMGAEGVIVGSAFVKIIDENKSNINIIKKRIEEFCRELKHATM